MRVQRIEHTGQSPGGDGPVRRRLLGGGRARVPAGLRKALLFSAITFTGTAVIVLTVVHPHVGAGLAAGADVTMLCILLLRENGRH